MTEPNWKEQLNPHLLGFCNSGHNADKVMHFISTQIIEKIIEEIPEAIMVDGGKWADDTTLKQQLRNKWLS